jgi:hypothetical protein
VAGSALAVDVQRQVSPGPCVAAVLSKKAPRMATASSSLKPLPRGVDEGDAVVR